MMVNQKDVFYYITLMNENYAQPNLDEASHEGVIRGGYHFGRYEPATSVSAKPVKNVTLMGSGAILTEAIKAAHLLTAQGVTVDVYSVTSWSELARDGLACASDGAPSHLTQILAKSQGAIVAASDYVRAVPNSIREWLPEGRLYTVLGTDGFGRSDTRGVLREFFGVNAQSIAKAAVGFD
jgi:pyruvate dehydrogenase E1 component